MQVAQNRVDLEALRPCRPFAQLWILSVETNELNDFLNNMSL